VCNLSSHFEGQRPESARYGTMDCRHQVGNCCVQQGVGARSKAGENIWRRVRPVEASFATASAPLLVVIIHAGSRVLAGVHSMVASSNECTTCPHTVKANAQNMHVMAPGIVWTRLENASFDTVSALAGGLGEAVGEGVRPVEGLFASASALGAGLG